MSDLFRSIISSGMARALIAKGLRWGGALVAGYCANWLAQHGATANDADIVKSGILMVVTGGGSALFSVLDAKHVDTQVKCVQASTAQAVAAGIATGAVTPAQVSSQATAALAAPKTASEPLAQTISALKAGIF